MVKKGDFLEIEYTGIMKEEGIVFDTTDLEVAKANELYNEKANYDPIIICLGQGHLLKGLEEELEGKEIGKDLTIELSPEKAFGKKDVKFIKMIPYSVFRKQQIEPQPGMQVNVDGAIGMVKTAAGGRCLVDFNHPLSGREVIYKVKINKIITDDKEKIKSVLALSLNLETDIEIKENNAKIKIKKEIPKEIQENVIKNLKELIPSVKTFDFVIEKEPEKK